MLPSRSTGLLGGGSIGDSDRYDDADLRGKPAKRQRQPMERYFESMIEVNPPTKRMKNDFRESSSHDGVMSTTTVNDMICTGGDNYEKSTDTGLASKMGKIPNPSFLTEAVETAEKPPPPQPSPASATSTILSTNLSPEEYDPIISVIETRPVTNNKTTTPKIQQCQQHHYPYQRYHCDHSCPFCGYKCSAEKFPDGLVNHFRRYHSHQYHFTVESKCQSGLASLSTQNQLGSSSSSSSTLAVMESKAMDENSTSSNSQSLDPADDITQKTTKMANHISKNTKSNDEYFPDQVANDDNSKINENGRMATVVVTAIPIGLCSKVGVDRESDQCTTRTFYYLQSKLPIAISHHQRDEMNESNQEWRADLREKMVMDLADASEKEKKFLCLWNEYWLSRPACGKRLEMSPEAVQEFICLYTSHLETLEIELMTHLTVLWEHRLLSSIQMEECMDYYQRLKRANS